MGWLLLIIGAWFLVGPSILQRGTPRNEKDAQNRETIYRHWGKWRIAGAFFFFIGLGIVAGPPDEGMYPPQSEIAQQSSPVSAPLQSTPQKGIGVSYDQTMAYLSNFFTTMSQDVTLKGQARHMGRTDDGLAMLEVLGPTDNIQSATLMVAIPKDNTVAVVRNGALLLRLLKNTVPEWEGSADWANSTLGHITRSQDTSEEISRGDKSIKMTVIKELGMVALTVQSKEG